MEKITRKYLRVRMSDGLDYDIPADRVADNFANAQASKECRGIKESLEKLYSVYFELAMTSDMELMEWASTKMSWKDLSSHARLVKVAETPHYDKDWEKAIKRVVVY
jgi:hypothetical protein